MTEKLIELHFTVTIKGSQRVYILPLLKKELYSKNLLFEKF